MGNPNYFFDGARRESLLAVRTNSEEHAASLSRCRDYFNLNPSASAQPPKSPASQQYRQQIVHSFQTFVDANTALQNWSRTTTEVLRNREEQARSDEGSSLDANNQPVTFDPKTADPSGSPLVSDVQNEVRGGFALLQETEIPEDHHQGSQGSIPVATLISLPPPALSSYANPSERYPGSAFQHPSFADYPTNGKVYDVSDNYIRLKARSEVFLMPNAYVLDQRTQQRVLCPKHFVALRSLINDINAEATRLRGIEQVILSPNVSPASTPQTRPLRSGTLFYPRIGEFEYLRDSLQLILSIGITEDELSTLSSFRAVYELLAKEYVSLQEDLGHFNISMMPRTVPGRTGSAADLQINRSSSIAPPMGLVRRFTDFRQRLKHHRNAFILDIRKKNVTHQVATPGKTPRNTTAGSGAAAGQAVPGSSWKNGWGVARWVATTVPNFFSCAPEVPAHHNGAPVVQSPGIGATVGCGGSGSPESLEGSPLLEQKHQLLGCIDELWAQTEGLATLLEHRFPTLFHRSWSEHVKSLAGDLGHKVEELKVVFSSS